MRVSTQTLFDHGVSTMLARQQEVVKTQSHISTGKRVIAPSDDPVAAAQMLDVSGAKSANKQFADNAASVKARLGQEEASLSAITRLLQDVRTLVVQSGSGALTPGDLRSIAEDVNGRYAELIGLANATDGSGKYLFAGFSSSTKPFAETAPGVVAYFGDEGRQDVAVSTSRAIAVNDSGADILQRIKNGNGTFATAASGLNTGTGVISPGSVVDSTALTGHDYTINFTVVGDVTTYDIVDSTSATTIASNVPFVAEGPITIAGMQLAIEGAPATGDSFTVQPSSSVSVFSTLSALRTALRTAEEGDVANASLTNALNTANSNLTNALDRVLAVTASVGTRLRETEAVLATNEDLDLNYQARLSELGDLDYARAITDLNFQQMHLEASQKSFMLITGLSLFKML